MAAANGVRFASRLLVESMPDDILAEEVATERLPGGTGSSRRGGGLRLATEALVDLEPVLEPSAEICLAPGGACACAGAETSSSSGACYRVRVPAAALLGAVPWAPAPAPPARPLERPEAAAAAGGARSRTPSPECGCAPARGHSPPPPLLLPAPPSKWLSAAAPPPETHAGGTLADVPSRSSSSGRPPPAADGRALGLAQHQGELGGPLGAPGRAPWGALGAAAAAGVWDARGVEGAAAAGGSAAEGGGRRQRTGRRRNLLQVATQLKKLDLLDPLLVVRVRKIGRLGFGSAELLRAHFERFGPVDEVLLSGVEDRQDGPQQRLRPSGFGFVVMASADAARRALAEPAHEVAGVCIEVRRFERLQADTGPEPDAGQTCEVDPLGRDAFSV